jgi:hypothetical protein
MALRIAKLYVKTVSGVTLNMILGAGEKDDDFVQMAQHADTRTAIAAHSSSDGKTEWEYLCFWSCDSQGKISPNSADDKLILRGKPDVNGRNL